MANKKTNKEYFAEVRAIAENIGNQEVASWAQAQIEILEKRSANRKPTKVQLANVELRERVREVMVGIGKPATVGEIIKAGNFGEEVTSQKMTAILAQLVEAKAAENTKDKKHSYYAAI